MNIDAYWQLVHEARESTGDPRDIDAVAETLVNRLTQMTLADIRDADRIYRQLAADAYSWQLWGAAYLIQGGCSDDGFDYFLGWLIGQGRDTYSRALADPDALADVINEDEAGEAESEEFSSVAMEAHHRVTGRYHLGDTGVPVPELGPAWDFDDEAEMRRRYPRLAETFLS